MRSAYLFLLNLCSLFSGARLNDRNSLANLTSPPLGVASASPLAAGILPNNSFGLSPFSRASVGQNSVGASSSLFESFNSGSIAPNISPVNSAQSQPITAASLLDKRLREQVESNRITISPWNDDITDIQKVKKIPFSCVTIYLISFLFSKGM